MIAKLKTHGAKLEAVNAKLDSDAAKLEAEKTEGLAAEDYARAKAIKEQVDAWPRQILTTSIVVVVVAAFQSTRMLPTTHVGFCV